MRVTSVPVSPAFRAQTVAYQDAWHVESTFRDLKHPLWIHWQPQFHWTDDIGYTA